jgi:hypothetical protein
MPKRPLSVTVLSLLMIAAGAVGIVYHFGDFNAAHRTSEVWLLLALRLLAIVAGGFMLRGDNWARWLALAWITFHVVVSALDSWTKMGMHALLLVVFVFFLFRPDARNFFAGRRT